MAGLDGTVHPFLLREEFTAFVGVRRSMIAALQLSS
jgi:hypothetical protein